TAHRPKRVPRDGVGNAIPGGDQLGAAQRPGESARLASARSGGDVHSVGVRRRGGRRRGGSQTVGRALRLRLAETGRTSVGQGRGASVARAGIREEGRQDEGRRNVQEGGGAQPELSMGPVARRWLEVAANRTIK